MLIKFSNIQSIQSKYLHPQDIALLQTDEKNLLLDIPAYRILMGGASVKLKLSFQCIYS